MKYSLFTRLLSLVLVFALMVPCFPLVTAEEIAAEITEMTEATEAVEPSEETEVTEATEPSEETEVTEPSEETEATEATEPSEETEATEATEPSEETEVTEPSEETEATEPSEETEPTEETEPEETEPEELPYGFLGMPEGYEISARNRSKRDAMKEHAVLETMSGLTAGKDYVSNQIMVAAESEEEALLIAEAYCGELTDYANELALITLHTATTLEAVEASLNEELNLPAASPNYTFQLAPIIPSAPATFAADVPTELDWSDWVQDIMTNPDPALEEPWSYKYQYYHDAIDTYAAWGVTTGRNTVKVAVVDSGVDSDHSDLNVSTYNVGCGTEDENGHGTHVIGIIAAEMDNGLGGAGIAPNVSITSYRCADSSGSISDYYLYQGIYYATSHGANIINLSLGGYWDDYAYDVEYAIRRANSYGVTVIAAMGNDGSNTLCYPAAYDGVIAVAATDRSNRRAWYSNYGAWCDISAPGSDIYSTYLNNSWTWLDGTSMAAPVVTAACALYMSWFGTVSPAQMEKILESSATKCPDSGMGAGIVNIANMLDGKPSAPTFRLYNSDGSILYDYEAYDGSVVPCETRLSFATYGHDDSWYVLYTTNGKTPGVKNGQIINGTEVNGMIDLSQFAGSTVTIKAVQVSGMGVPGKVMTKKIKVADSILVTGVTISGAERIVSGKSSQFTATVLPAEKADQSVEWSIVSRSNTSLSSVKISSKGLLTTTKNAYGTIGIRAISTVSGVSSSTYYVDIAPVDPVYKVTLNGTTATGFIGQYLQLTPTLTAKNGSVIRVSDVGVQWTSSNTKVATVDDTGYVTAVGKGKAVITCKALDGSNKSAKCTVTIKQQVTGITITGNASVAPGKSATYKATAAPTTANTKGVNWSLISAPAGVTISASGKVTVPSYVTSGTIKIRATAKDGRGATATYTISIQPQVTSLSVRMYSAYNGLAAGPVYNSKGALTTVNLFSVDMPESDYADNFCDLWFSYDGAARPSVSLTSSNPSVASVNSDGHVTAHKPGTAKITFKALDGSNKSASVTIKVTNPVSYMEIKTNAPQMTNFTPYIGIGKSVTNSVYFGDTYGTVSNKKVVWDYDVYVADYQGNLLGSYTNYAKNNKLITVSSSGKVTVKKGMVNAWDDAGSTNGIFNELVLYLYAYSTDGSGTMASKMFYLIPPTTKMQMEYKTYICYANDGGIASFYSDQWHLFEDYYESGFIATSSNPKVASVIGIYPYDDGTYVYGNWYDCYFATGQKGTAKITIKAADGSGKSCSFTVKVK